jgi:hypothetical protein
MGIGVSLFLLAVGAILTFAVNASVNGVDISAVGVILMIIGGVGLLLSLLLIGAARGRRTTVIDHTPDERYY